MTLKQDMRKKRNYYILIGMSLIFIVSSLVIGIWYYQKINRDNASNTLKYNESIVKLMQNKIDSELNEAHYIEYYIETNGIIQKKLKDSAIDLQDKRDIMQLLNRLRDSMSLLDDIWIYFEDEDLIVSSRNITKPEIYFETQCPIIGQTYENWKNEYLLRPKYREFYPSQKIKLSDTISQRVMIYKKTLYSTLQDVPKMHILMTVNLDGIEKLIGGIDSELSNNFLIADTDGEIIYRTGTSNFMFNPKDVLLNSDQTVSYNGDYVIYKKSANFNLIYCVGVSENLILHNVNSFMYIGIFLIVLYLFLVLGYLYTSITLSYKPIKIIMNKIGKNDFEPGKSASELDFITTKIDEMVEKENIYEGQMERMVQYKRNSAAKDLLLGNHSSDETEQIEWEHEYFLTAIVHVMSMEEFKDESERQFVKYTVLNMLRELFGKIGKSEMVEMNQSDIVTIFNFKESQYEEIIQAIQENVDIISNIIESSLNATLITAISGAYKGGKKVALCYKEAKAAINFRSLNDEENLSVIRYDRINDAEQTQDSWYYWPSNLRDMLLEYVNRGDYNSIENTIDEIIQLNMKKPSDVEILGECLYYNIFGILINISTKYITTYSIVNIPRYDNNIPFIDNIDALKNRFSELCDIMKINNKGDLKLLNRIEEYIDGHFAESSLSVTEIADNMQISTSYMQAYFKKHKNTTLTRYITQKRVDYAKQMLLNTNLTISTIAVKAGFTDPLYFGKIFKKNEGITPSKYRDTLNN